MSSSRNELEQVAGRAITNYASCRGLIRGKSIGNPANSEFYASLLVCFGEPDISKEPIDDLHSKAIATILLAADKYAEAQMREARIDELNVMYQVADEISRDNGAAAVGEVMLEINGRLAALNQKEETDGKERS